MCICRFCNKVCKNDNSLRNHERLCKLNPERQLIKSNFIKWNEKRKLLNIPGENQFTKAAKLGLEKPIVSEETRRKLSIAAKKRIVTDQTKQKISNSMQQAVKNHPESYSSCRVNGRVKVFEYNGVKLNGMWEVDFAKYLDEYNIKWIRPKNGFEYIWENKTHIYYPDFYLSRYDLYVEVKGYVRNKDYYKWNAVHNLLIIKYPDIKNIRNKTFDIFSVIENTTKAL